MAIVGNNPLIQWILGLLLTVFLILEIRKRAVEGGTRKSIVDEYSQLSDSYKHFIETQNTLIEQLLDKTETSKLNNKDDTQI